MKTLLACLLCASPAFAGGAQPNPYGIPPELDAGLRSALRADYELRFEDARRIIGSLAPYRDAHPMVCFGEVLTEWWRLTAGELEEDLDASAPFAAAARGCIEKAKEKTARGDPHGEGLAVRGAALGLLGRWHIKNRHWLRAYLTGRKAKRVLERALRVNPRLKDPHSGIGIYDYFVAKLPGLVRMLTFIGAGGDPAAGLREAEIALREGSYTAVGTKAALAVIQIRNEEAPAEGLRLIDEVLAEYPKSAFFHVIRAIALYDLDRPKALAVEARRQDELLKAGGFPAGRGAQIRFFHGLARFRARDWEGAARHYREAIADGQYGDPFSTWARLHLAHTLDVRGRREEAVALYREVRGMTNRWGSRWVAGVYLERPFRGSAEEMTRLLPGS